MVGSWAEKGRKKTGGTPVFPLRQTLLAKDGVAKPATNMSQFGKSKFLNFNGSFNNCGVHTYPLLREENTSEGRDCRSDSLGRQFLWEVSVRSAAVSPNG